MTSYYAQPVPGSAALRTRRTGADPTLASVETLAASEFVRQQVGDQVLGRAVVRAAFVPVLKQVFDELLPQLEPIEQLLYLQLYRRAFGEERNFCRVARRELCQATGFSVRRFNRALAGLVRRGAVRLMQRDRQGTCYRVLLPRELAGLQPGTEVMLGRLGPAPRAKSARRAERATRHHKMIPIEQPQTVGQAVAVLVELLPAAQRQSGAIELVQELTAALEDGIELAVAQTEARALLAAGAFNGEQFGQALRQRLGLGPAEEGD